MDYDYSGYYQLISLEDPKNFYEDMNRLINGEWIDEDTLSIIIDFNIYSLNNDLFVYFSILWENQGLYYKKYPVISVVDLTMKDGNGWKISLGLSFIVIACKIFNLKLMKKRKELGNDMKADKTKDNNENSYKEKILDCCIFKFFKENFRSPNVIELLSKFP